MQYVELYHRATAFRTMIYVNFEEILEKASKTRIVKRKNVFLKDHLVLIIVELYLNLLKLKGRFVCH